MACARCNDIRGRGLREINPLRIERIERIECIERIERIERTDTGSMRSTRSMRGGFIFRSLGTVQSWTPREFATGLFLDAFHDSRIGPKVLQLYSMRSMRGGILSGSAFANLTQSKHRKLALGHTVTTHSIFLQVVAAVSLQNQTLIYDLLFVFFATVEASSL